MNEIGVSLHVGTLLDEPETDAQAVLKQEYGTVQNMLAFLRSQNVASIEVRNVREKMPVEKSVAAIRVCHDAGFKVSVHVAFEERSGSEYAYRVRGVLDAALEGQDALMLTLHPIPSDAELTLKKYEDWSGALYAKDARISVALENMRVTKPNTEANRLTSVYQVVNALENTVGRGLCWDMGHYAYNVRALALSGESVPDRAVRARMIHTHIHSLYIPDDARLPEEMKRTDTHYPLKKQNEPVAEYVRTLMADGYKGLYNIELEPERFIGICTPRTGFESSVIGLREMMK